jgi:hypothetical protein
MAGAGVRGEDRVRVSLAHAGGPALRTDHSRLLSGTLCRRDMTLADLIDRVVTVFRNLANTRDPPDRAAARFSFINKV